MNKIAVTLAAAVLLAAAPARAGEGPQLPPGVFLEAQTSDQYLAKDQLIGAKVLGPDGKIVGDIEDLIVNDYNLVTGVVMGTGGFLGLAEKKVAISLRSLKFDDTSGKTVITLPEATKENIALAPAFTRTHPKKSLMERAKEKAQELTDKTTASTTDAVEKAKPKIEEAKQKATDAMEAAKEAAQPTLDKAKEIMKDAQEKVGEAVEAAKEAAKELEAPEIPAEPAPVPDAAPAPAPEAPSQNP